MVNVSVPVSVPRKRGFDTNLDRIQIICVTHFQTHSTGAGGVLSPRYLLDCKQICVEIAPYVYDFTQQTHTHTQSSPGAKRNNIMLIC